MILFWFLHIYHHKLIKHLIQQFCRSSILVQMVLYFCNSLSLSIQKDINLLSLFLSLLLSLKVLTYPLILGNIRNNGHVASSKYPVKFSRLFVLINFEITILSIITSEFCLGFFAPKFFFCNLCLTKSLHYHTIRKCCCHYFLAN